MDTLFLVGPTAVGKSAVGLLLAERLGAEIVSADSMQIYQGLDIGTAKPTAAERARVRHHLLDVCLPSEKFDVRQFLDQATNALTAIHQRGKTALVVGGSGLYIRALRQGLFEGPARDPAIRSKLEVMSTPTLFAELQRVDPVTAATIDRHNPRRLVRALEVFYSTGQPISTLQQQWAGDSRPAAPGFVLDRDRAELHVRIEQRIDEQLAAGWLDEVRRLIAQPLPEQSTALQAAGYRELAAHLRGELSIAEAVVLVKARTRQLAKRQLTWFRKEPGLAWLRLDRAESPAAAAARIMAHLEMGETHSA